MIDLHGHYQDGETSRSLPARLTAEDQECVLVTDAFELRIANSNLEISDRLGNTPRRISWGEKSCFVCLSNEGVDQLQEFLGVKLDARVHRLESRLGVALLALAMVVALLGFALLWGVPQASRILAMKIPNGVSQRVARQTLTTVDKLVLSPSSLSAARQSELRNLLHRSDDFAAKIEFRRGGPAVGANAFALPAGFIVITDELVALAAEDNEIVAVYLHEVGHARSRHAEAMVIQNSTWLVALAFLTGDIAGVSEALFLFPVFLGQMSFSRDLEREADDYAVSKLRAAGLNPSLLADMLERLTESTQTSTDSTGQHADKRWQEYFSTHPDTQQRAKRIRGAGPGTREPAED